jgi:uncharacterized membrane protein (UPF0182 family)
VMENTLDAALERLFPGGGTAQPQPPAPPGTSPQRPQPVVAGGEGLAAQAQRTYQQALQAQRAGDWAQYGEHLKRLGELLLRLNSQKTPE